MPLVLGIDPGFASVGYALVNVLPKTTEIVSIGVIRTTKWKPKKPKKGQKAEKQTKPSASEDNLDRAQKIAEALGALMKGVEVVCVEAMSHPRNASAAAKMSLCWGVIATLTKLYRTLDVLQISPQKLKINLVGNKEASKQEIQAALNIQFGAAEIAHKGLSNIAKGQWEHPYDALGAVAACLDRPEIAKLRLPANEKE